MYQGLGGGDHLGDGDVLVGGMGIGVVKEALKSSRARNILIDAATTFAAAGNTAEGTAHGKTRPEPILQMLEERLRLWRPANQPK